MIHTHCGQKVIRRSDNQVYFSVRCQVCRKTFTQKKRQPKGKGK